MAIGALATGDAIAQDANLGTRVRMGDGETLVVEARSLVVSELISDGRTTIKFGADSPDNEAWVWLLDGGRSVSGTLVIDVSGSDGRSARGDSRSGRTINVAEEGGPGRAITICIVFSEGESELVERIAAGHGVLPGRLRIVSKGGDGGNGTLRNSFNNAELRDGANSGNGGNVRLRLLMLNSWDGSQWRRSREIETGEWTAWSDRFNVEADFAGGLAGKGTDRVNVGRQRPLWLPAGRDGVKGDSGGVELEMAAVSYDDLVQELSRR